MQTRRLNKILAVIFIILTVIFGIYVYYTKNNKTSIPNPTQPANIETTEDIQVTNLKAGQKITSPLVIKGKAKGNWFFEASFPIKLLDEKRNVIATTHATAQGDWMVNDFVPFEATVNFDMPKTTKGTLVLQNDNPSGLPEKDKQIQIIVNF